MTPPPHLCWGIHRNSLRLRSECKQIRFVSQVSTWRQHKAISAWVAVVVGFCSAALIPWLWTLCVALRDKRHLEIRYERPERPNLLSRLPGFQNTIWFWAGSLNVGSYVTDWFLQKKKSKARMALSKVHNSAKVQKSPWINFSLIRYQINRVYIC